MTCHNLSSNRITAAPVYAAVGFAWLAVALYVIFGGIIVRATALGGLAQFFDALPSSISRIVFFMSWSVFLLGWTIPLGIGLKQLFRRTKDLAR